MSVLEPPDGTAPSIVAAVCKLCDDLNLDMRNRVCGLGSDGASVMHEVCGGVSKRLKDKVPFLAAHHSIAHRLALACGESADEISYLKQFKRVLGQLYHFYSNFAVHTIQQVFMPSKRCKRPSIKVNAGKRCTMTVTREGS